MSQTLRAPLRNKASAALAEAGLDGNGRFHSLSSALSAAFAVLAKHGIEAADVIGGDMLLGNTGSRQVGLAFSNKEDSFSPVPVRNSLLAFTWAKLETGYEVVAYLS